MTKLYNVPMLILLVVLNLNELNLSLFASAADSQHQLLKDMHEVPIKVVNELPSENNIVLGIDQPEPDFSFDRGRRKEVKLSPAPFSGPQQLQKLAGLCFTYLDEKYKYKLCPFSNITQEEVQSLQEPYKAVLGVWGEWIIENNNFKALHLVEGAKCGSGTRRAVKINLRCGTFSRLVKITEPSKCLYEGFFETPLVCGENSLVVYPRLPKELQLEWDRVETEKYHGILTQKGYDEELRQIFVKGGFILLPESRKVLNHELNDDDNSECKEGRKSLEKRVKELEKEVEEKNDLIRNLTERISKKELHR